MEIDLVKLVENVRLSSPSLSMQRLDLPRAKRFLRWTWLRLSTRRFLARNAEAEAAASARVDFAAMLEDEDGADVTFIVGDRQFRAYRRVLAAGSPVFAAELFGPMKETSAPHVRIDDMDPAIFEALLRFACTGALPEPDVVDGVAPLQHLLVAADRYGMHGLLAACEWRLCRSIDVESVASTLALAEQHRRAKLKDACIGFVSTKSVLSAVRETEGFAHLLETCPLVVVDILEQKLPSRVTRILTLCGSGLALGVTYAQQGLTRAQQGLARIGTKAQAFFRRADVQEAGIFVAFFSAFGICFFVIIKIEESQAREKQASLDRSLRELRSLTARRRETAFSLAGSLGRLHRYLLARQSLSSWLPRVSLAALGGRLREFQENAWLNSDI